MLEGLFGLAERLFGVRIAPADGDAPVWHPDVRFFRVSDPDGGARAASGGPIHRESGRAAQGHPERLRHG